MLSNSQMSALSPYRVRARFARSRAGAARRSERLLLAVLWLTIAAALPLAFASYATVYTSMHKEDYRCAATSR